MRITRLQARDIGRHRDLDIELAAGVTVVRGPNESGKSTIQRIIELALTRKVTSANADLDAIRAWDADEEARPWVRLEFLIEDEDGVRSGELEKAFRGAKGTVRLVVDGEVTTDPTEADLRIAELTGIPTEPFFRSTASVRHHELEQLDRDEANLHDRLQASISGADRGTSAAKKKLERALKELTKAGDKNPGRLKVADEAVRRSATIVDQGEAALVQLERDRDVLSGAQERRAVVEGRLTEDRAMLEKARQAERLISEQAQAQERFERFRTGRPGARRDRGCSRRATPPRIRCRSSTRSSIRLRSARRDDPRPDRAASRARSTSTTSSRRPSRRGGSTAGLALVLVVVGIAPRPSPAASSLTGAAVLLPVGAGAGHPRGGRRPVRRLGSARVADLRRQKELAERGDRSPAPGPLADGAGAPAGGRPTTRAQLAALGLPDLAAAEALLAAEKEHVAQIDQHHGRPRGPGRPPAARDAARAARCGGARDRPEVGGPRTARADRPRAAGAGAPRDRSSGTAKRRSNGRATTRPAPRPGRGEHGRRRAGRRRGRAPGRLARAAGGRWSAGRASTRRP